jgi:hypothetical protein
MKLTVRISTLFFFFFFLAQTSFGQYLTVSNYNFSNGTTGWGCNPEVNYEGTYGGSSWSSNRVAEVDQEAGLCQTISGFVPGAVYRLRFQASRRTNCGPTAQSIRANIAELSGFVSRNGTNFNFTWESFDFTATSASHVLSFTSPLSGTCNILVDNIEIKLISALPVELTSFIAKANAAKKVDLAWTTASEERNDFYTIDRSADGKNWETIAKVDGVGTTFNESNYTFTDEQPLNGVSYYRLSQTDEDGTHEELEIASVEIETAEALSAYPNPANDVLNISGVGENDEIKVLDGAGREMPFSLKSAQYGVASIDISSIPAGNYLVKTANGYLRFIKA